MSIGADLEPPDGPYAMELLRRGSYRLSAFDRSARKLRQCHVRLLEPADLDQLIELNRILLAALPHPHVFRAYPEDFLEMNIVSRGRTIGAFFDGRLIAHALLYFPGDDDANFGYDIDLPREERLRVAHFDGSGVHPDFRGSSLQRTLNDLRRAYAASLGFCHIMVTVSPLNPHSLRNHMDGTALEIRAAKMKYDGMERFTLHRDLRIPLRPTGGTSSTIGQIVGLTDFARHQSLLAIGWVGATFIDRPETGHEILYLPENTGKTAEVAP